MCIQPDCDRPSYRRKLCTVHLIDCIGACANHPDRPVHARNLCRSCNIKDWRRRNGITSGNARRIQYQELLSAMQFFIREIRAVRAPLARYLRTSAHPDWDAWYGWKLLCGMYDECFSQTHVRFILTEINRGAPPSERIPMYRVRTPHAQSQTHDTPAAERPNWQDPAAAEARAVRAAS